MAHTRGRGQAAEDRAVAFLERAGVRIVDRNVIAGGVELDIVGLDISSDHVAPGDDSGTYIFVEVRSRSHQERGHPAETIDGRKRRRVVKGATAWLVSRGLWERVHVRFDVVTVIGHEAPGSDQDGGIDWIVSAFEA